MDFIKKIILTFLILFSCTSYAYVNNIKFGILNFYPPFVFSGRNGEVYGFDIEIAQIICQKLHMTCTFTRMPLADLFEALKNNKIDAIISAIYVTPDRKKIFDFTEPYYKSTSSYMSLANANIEISKEGLQGKKIGALTASLFYTYLVQTYPNIAVVKTYLNVNEPIDELAKGNLDLVLFDTATIRYWIQTSQNLFKSVDEPIEIPGNEGYAIVVRKGNTELVEALNNQLNQMKASGQLNQLIQKYFSL